eukprot:766751-Hanusia_phi.AAC.10
MAGRFCPTTGGQVGEEPEACVTYPRLTGLHEFSTLNEVIDLVARAGVQREVAEEEQVLGEGATDSEEGGQ